MENEETRYRLEKLTTVYSWSGPSEKWIPHRTYGNTKLYDSVDEAIEDAEFLQLKKYRIGIAGAATAFIYASE